MEWDGRVNYRERGSELRGGNDGILIKAYEKQEYMETEIFRRYGMTDSKTGAYVNFDVVD